ncbi:putative glyoxalase superfamily protein PhnB [Caulobacter ginsengisoli]|uniref:Glyoxalase superfamily protein PhnB n=1 Tax=Caulobacter ginsengisoli TaxID=400775 RepID=A0ABU0IL86_9CAUL|nr:VOC family protein [Caulobacter ginsengisoli]MDQ0462770.1 putative glyoxalase superfamily protein PhnB [Caulobacter ginsengisoli]
MSAQVLSPCLSYRDRRAAMDWLEAAFGFEVSLLVTDDKGEIGHAEMSYRDASITIAGEWAMPELIGPAALHSPANQGGRVTGFLRVFLEDGIDAHCERARAAGARITAEPTDQFYGDRVYRCLDLDGHIWTFSQPVANPTLAEMEAASGFKLSAGKEA